jgi:predicted AlkP superfamily pyrophosphatase or phosphodiesterase
VDASDGAAPGPLAATKHVLLISIDGMHQVDYAKYVAANPTSALATLAGTGVEYSAAHTTTPSDSFPGMLALVTGGTPKSTGVYYDDSYDRTLYAPGPLGCTQPVGSEAVFDESIEYDDTLLFSGGIDADHLPWALDAQGNCTHVWPHQFVKVNTLFEVIHFGGGYTAWSDKHPAYDILNGPSGKGIDDLYTPEVNSDPSLSPVGKVNGVDLHAALAKCDTTNGLASVGDFTQCMPTIMAYDDTKVQAVLNWIDGKTSDGSTAAPVPVVFGMNFQTISVGEKLPIGGYSAADGTPNAQLLAGLQHVDQAIGKMVAELKAQNLLSSTLIIVTAKHGQSPIDHSKLAMENGATPVTDPITYVTDPTFATQSSYSDQRGTFDTLGHLQTDDVGMIWIQHQAADGGVQDSTTAASIVTALTTNAAAIHADTLPSGTVFQKSINSGADLTTLFGDPATDPVAAAREPDIFIQPNWGVIYSGSSKKIAEHGGSTTDDTNVMLLVSIPGLATASVTTAVSTTQVAPTILQALKYDPSKLQAVVKEGTVVLPSLF